ncbi:MAG: hypothetical protein IT339_02895 [Thermomicrobiales bacterium]|nr:hypothetical protein [Thermomicrobiales bacterium]
MYPTKTITQTIAKAAVKTFLQAFLAILVLLAVPVLTGWAEAIGNGERIVIDVDFWLQVLIAATGAGIAALISLVWNWSKRA